MKIKISIVALILAATLLIVTACSSDATTSTTAACTSVTTTQTIAADISADTSVAAGTSVCLSGIVNVNSGATLTIGSGSTIYGDPAKFTALVIQQGAKIMAIGTAASPIVFTSGNATGSRTASDWGGIVIQGKAPTNTITASNTGTTEISTGDFGGTDWADNSGTIQYVRIEFAGKAIATDKEFNGLFLAGVGSGTTIDHLQSHRGSDDGIEIFGGTVDLKYIISDSNQDDQWDIDEGYYGTIQYAVFACAADSDNAIEYDGLGADASRASMSTISNATILGHTSKTKESFINIRKSGGVAIENSYLGHYKGSKAPIKVGDSALSNRGTTTAVMLKFQSNYIENMMDASGNARTTANAANGVVNSYNETTNVMVNSDIATQFPDGNANNIPAAGAVATSGLKISNTPSSGTLWGAASGAAEFKAAITGTYSDPAAVTATAATGAANTTSTDLAVSTYIGAFSSTSDTWADSWTSFPSN